MRWESACAAALSLWVLCVCVWAWWAARVCVYVWKCVSVYNSASLSLRAVTLGQQKRHHRVTLIRKRWGVSSCFCPAQPSNRRELKYGAPGTPCREARPPSVCRWHYHTRTCYRNGWSLNSTRWPPWKCRVMSIRQCLCLNDKIRLRGFHSNKYLKLCCPCDIQWHKCVRHLTQRYLPTFNCAICLQYTNQNTHL